MTTYILNKIRPPLSLHIILILHHFLALFFFFFFFSILYAPVCGVRVCVCLLVSATISPYFAKKQKTLAPDLWFIIFSLVRWINNFVYVCPPPLPKSVLHFCVILFFLDWILRVQNNPQVGPLPSLHIHLSSFLSEWVSVCVSFVRFDSFKERVKSCREGEKRRRTRTQIRRQQQKKRKAAECVVSSCFVLRCTALFILFCANLESMPDDHAYTHAAQRQAPIVKPHISETTSLLQQRRRQQHHRIVNLRNGKCCRRRRSAAWALLLLLVLFCSCVCVWVNTTEWFGVFLFLSFFCLFVSVLCMSSLSLSLCFPLAHNNIDAAAAAADATTTTTTTRCPTSPRCETKWTLFLSTRDFGPILLFFFYTISVVGPKSLIVISFFLSFFIFCPIYHHQIFSYRLDCRRRHRSYPFHFCAVYLFVFSFLSLHHSPPSYPPSKFKFLFLHFFLLLTNDFVSSQSGPKWMKKKNKQTKLKSEIPLFPPPQHTRRHTDVMCGFGFRLKRLARRKSWNVMGRRRRQRIESVACLFVW